MSDNARDLVPVAKSDPPEIEDFYAMIASEGGAARDQSWKIEGRKGRQSSYTPEVAAEMCERVASGETVMSICREEGKPHVSTFYFWLDRYPAFGKAFARAREYASNALIDKAVEAAESATGKDDAQAARVKADTFIKVAGRLNPKQWAERKEGQPAVAINITSNLDDPRQDAVAQGEYRITYEDAEVVDDDAPDAYLLYLKEQGIEL